MNIRATLQHVFTPDYIFDFSSMVQNPNDRVYMIFGLLLVMIGVVFKIISNFAKNPVTKTLWHRLASPLIVGGVLEVVWFAARDQNIKLFGSHFVAWGIALVVLFWIYFPIRYFFAKYKDEKKNWEKQQIKLKYIK